MIIIDIGIQSIDIYLLLVDDRGTESILATDFC
jgi:hypothetical protein